jgi:hypothetical protein
MNSQLLNNRPKDSTPEEFKKAWDNSSYVFEALWKTIEGYIADNNKVKKDDFSCPNHYALLAYQAGLSEAFNRILTLLPESAKPLQGKS